MERRKTRTALPGGPAFLGGEIFPRVWLAAVESANLGNFFSPGAFAFQSPRRALAAHSLTRTRPSVRRFVSKTAPPRR